MAMATPPIRKKTTGNAKPPKTCVGRKPGTVPSRTSASSDVTPRRAMTMLSLSDVSRDFITRGKTIQAMAGVSLDVTAGEFLTVVGPSGCGKSTLLNIVCGLLAPSRGSVLYKGARLTGVNTEIGYVTQADNLYPWRTLREHVEFPLEIRGVARGERRARAAALIERVGLAGLEDHYPY